jgi:hypothetical protein
MLQGLQATEAYKAGQRGSWIAAAGVGLPQLLQPRQVAGTQGLGGIEEGGVGRRGSRIATAGAGSFFSSSTI